MYFYRVTLMLDFSEADTKGGAEAGYSSWPPGQWEWQRRDSSLCSSTSGHQFQPDHPGFKQPLHREGHQGVAGEVPPRRDRGRQWNISAGQSHAGGRPRSVFAFWMQVNGSAKSLFFCFAVTETVLAPNDIPWDVLKARGHESVRLMELTRYLPNYYLIG